MKKFFKNLVYLLFFSQFILFVLERLNYPSNAHFTFLALCLPVVGLLLAFKYATTIKKLFLYTRDFFLTFFKGGHKKLSKKIKFNVTAILAHGVIAVFLISFLYILFRFEGVGRLFWGAINLGILTLLFWKKKALLLLTERHIFPASFAAISLLYGVIFVFFRLGNPLIYEDLAFADNPRLYREISVGDIHTYSYKSQLNNFGVVYLQFSSHGSSTEDEQNLFTSPSFPLHFSISEDGQPPFYENDYTLFWKPDQEEFIYEFGFPLQDFSKNKNYTINIESKDDEEKSFPLFIALNDSSEKLLIGGKYVIRLEQTTDKLVDVLESLELRFSHLNKKEILIFTLSILGTILFGSFFEKGKWRGDNSLRTTFLSSFFLQILMQAFILLGGEMAKNDFALSTTYLGIVSTACLLSFFIKEKGPLGAFLQNKRYPLDVIFIIGTITCALFLRLTNIGALNPNTDEYPHLISAKEILDKTSLLDQPYVRSYHIVTLPVALAFRFFGPTIEIARIVGALFSVLAMIPLYLIAKRINPLTAKLSLLFYALNPWIISLSRAVREYAYQPFYFFWIIYFMIRLYEAIPEKIKVIQDYKKLFSLKTIIWIILLVFPLVYMFHLGEVYTFRVIGISYLIFSCLLLTKIDFSYKENKIFFGLIALLGVLGASLVLPNQQFFSLQLRPAWVWLSYIFGNPVQQIYYDNLLFSQLALPLTALLGSISIFKKNKWPFFFILHFILYLYFFVFHFDRYSEPRYIHSVGLWYVLILATGMNFLIALVKNLQMNKVIYHLMVFSLFFLSFNFTHIFSIPFSQQYGKELISGRFHDSVEATAAFIKENGSPEDILIGANAVRYLLFQDGYFFKKYYTNYHWNEETVPQVLDEIENYDSGWIITDSLNYHRYGFNFEKDIKTPFKDRNITFETYMIDEQYILRWSK